MCRPRLTSPASKRSERKFFKVSSNEDQARLIAERVARRLAAESTGREPAAPTPRNGTQRDAKPDRARIINFVSPAPPPRTQSSIGPQPKASIDIYEPTPGAPQVAQSPWLAPFSRALPEPFRQNDNPQSAIGNPQSVDHPSQERFGIEEATVSELVEFFESEKQCAVDPSGKPCDHCAMCNSRGF